MRIARTKWVPASVILCAAAIAVVVACGYEREQTASQSAGELAGDSGQTEDGAIPDAGAPSACGVGVTATFTFYESRRIDGEATLSAALPFRIPALIPITAGGAERGHTRLRFHRKGREDVDCHYTLHRAATSFTLKGCSDGTPAGGLVTTDKVVLLIEGADDDDRKPAEVLQVSAVLDAPPSTRCSGVSASISVGPPGGHLVFPSGIVLDVPPGALGQTETVRANLLPAIPPFVADPSSVVTAVQLEPEGTIFTSSATLTIPLPADTPTTGLSVVALDDSDLLPPDAGAAGGQAGMDGGDELGVDDAGDDGEADGRDLVDSIEDSLTPELETITSVSSTSLQVLIDHFSVRIIFKNLPGLLSTYATTQAGCTNASVNVEGLSEQIMTVWQNPPANDGGLEAMPADLAPMKTTADGGPAPLSAFLNPQALSDLAKAKKINSRIEVGYAWRSLAAQYVVAKACKKRVRVASVGVSNHGQGAAVDLSLAENLPRSKEHCQSLVDANAGISPTDLLIALAPGKPRAARASWVRALLQNNWVWWGYYQPESITCADPVHFEHRHSASYPLDAGVFQVRPTTKAQGVINFPLLEDGAAAQHAHISAYQTLWNNSYPCDAIDNGHPGGQVDPDTLNALPQSPGNGFLPQYVTIPLIVPAGGVADAGCQLIGAQQPAGLICCPGGSDSGAAYSCQTSCGGQCTGAGCGPIPFTLTTATCSAAFETSLCKRLTFAFQGTAPTSQVFVTPAVAWPCTGVTSQRVYDPTTGAWSQGTTCSFACGPGPITDEFNALNFDNSGEVAIPTTVTCR